jgi:hypothetical protein
MWGKNIFSERRDNTDFKAMALVQILAFLAISVTWIVFLHLCELQFAPSKPNTYFSVVRVK